MCLKHVLSEALCLCLCDLLLRQYTVELSDCILTRIDLCRIDPRSVKDWPDVTGRSVTDWLEVWRIDQKLQTWHGKDRPEVIDQKCEGLTRSVKDWPEVCVWNMIDQKCEGLTRIDTENSFQFDQLRSLNNRILFSLISHQNQLVCIQLFWFEMCLKHVLSEALCLCLRSVACIEILSATSVVWLD